ncbi:MAG: hypothetical protein ACLP1E_16980 [Acidimicrobiales bacterium]
MAAVVSAGVGVFGAELFLHPPLNVSSRWPGALYCLVVLVGVVLVDLGEVVESPSVR